MAGGGGGVVVPLPVATTTCGLPTPSLVTVIAAVRSLADAGVKVRSNEHAAPGLTTPHVDAETANSAGLLLTMLATCTGALPMLVADTTVAGLEVPSTTLPKATESWIAS